MTQLLRTHMQDNELVSNRLGARTFALNLGQLPGCPTHWDLNEIPVIAAGFSILSPSRYFATTGSRRSSKKETLRRDPLFTLHCAKRQAAAPKPSIDPGDD